MESLFASGRIVDLALGVLLAEALLLSFLYWRRGRAAEALRLLPFLLAGGCLLAAMRTALAGGAWPVMAFWLSAALLAHLADLALRLGGRGAVRSSGRPGRDRPPAE